MNRLTLKDNFLFLEVYTTTRLNLASFDYDTYLHRRDRLRENKVRSTAAEIEDKS